MCFGKNMDNNHPAMTHRHAWFSPNTCFKFIKFHTEVWFLTSEKSGVQATLGLHSLAAALWELYYLGAPPSTKGSQHLALLSWI